MAAFKLVKTDGTGREYIAVELPEYAAYGRDVWVAPDKETLTFVGNALLEAAKSAGKLQKQAKVAKTAAGKAAASPVALDIAALVAAGFTKDEIKELILGRITSGADAPIKATANGVDASA